MIKTNREQDFHRKMLIDSKNILQRNGLEPILAGSALLGITREGDLIPWCPGVVLIVFSEEITEEITENIIKDFMKSGFEIQKQFIKLENYKIRVQKDKFNVEITGYIKGKDYYYRKLKHKKKVIPHEFLNKPYGILKFRGENFNVPKNTEEFLSFIYNDWKKVDKSNSPSIYKSKRHMVIDK